MSSSLIILEDELSKLKLEVQIMSETLRLIADHLTDDQKSAIAKIQEARTRTKDDMAMIAASSKDDYGTKRLKQLSDERDLRIKWKLA